jgi:hypothetical protein
MNSHLIEVFCVTVNDNLSVGLVVRSTILSFDTLEILRWKSM